MTDERAAPPAAIRVAGTADNLPAGRCRAMAQARVRITRPRR